MARRKREEEHANHERWLVSYADFITLLFAFFVVMYAISSVNEGKYRVLSSTLSEAFQEPSRSMNPVQVGELQRTSGTLQGDAITQSIMDTDIPMGPAPVENPVSTDKGFQVELFPDLGQKTQSEAERLNRIADSIEEVLRPLMNEGTVSVKRTGEWVEVDMKSQLLFDSGSAKLSNQALRILGDLARILGDTSNAIQVEGYTDNVPIHTAAFPSNWELSAARAASVVHLFGRLGMNPRRMAAVGYGEFRPVVENTSEEGRSRNRRVTIIIRAQSLESATPPARPEPLAPGGR